MTALRCECRHHAETNLRCARCDTPICPDCSRVGAVGMLCRACSSNRRSPLFQVSASGLALGYLGSLTAATVGGWIVASIRVGFGFYGLLLAFVYGIGVGEVALRITGRKRGPQMEIMAGASTAMGLLIGFAVHLLTLPMTPAVQRAGPVVSYLLDPMPYLILAVAVYGAISRIRNI